MHIRKLSFGGARGPIAAAVALVVPLLYVVVSGCASNTAASRNNAALDSYVQGVLAYQKGDTDTAMAKLQDAVNKKEDLVMARSMLGDLYRSKSDYEAAKQQYRVVARLDPYDYQHHYHLGLVYQFLNELQDAAAAYIRALNLKPTDAPSNMNLGTVYLALGKPEDAIVYAERAAELDPRSAPAFANLGVTLDAAGQFAKAETAYRKSLDLDSNQPLIRLYLGENLLQQKKATEARSVLAELVRVQDNSLHRKRLGDAYAGEKNYAEAVNQYTAALKQDPNYYPALNEIGAVRIEEYQKGLELDDAKRKSAVDSWQQSLSIRRDQPRILALVQKWSKAPMFEK